jgi:hypothetical protein
MTAREAMARWLSPDLGQDAERWRRILSGVEEMKRYVGHDFPIVEVVLDRLVIDARNASRSLDEKPIVQICGNLGGSWPSEIYSFREKLLEHFKPRPSGPQEDGSSRRTPDG